MPKKKPETLTEQDIRNKYTTWPCHVFRNNDAPGKYKGDKHIFTPNGEADLPEGSSWIRVATMGQDLDWDDVTREGLTMQDIHAEFERVEAGNLRTGKMTDAKTRRKHAQSEANKLKDGVQSGDTSQEANPPPADDSQTAGPNDEPTPELPAAGTPEESEFALAVLSQAAEAGDEAAAAAIEKANGDTKKLVKEWRSLRTQGNRAVVDATAAVAAGEAPAETNDGGGEGSEDGEDGGESSKLPSDQ